MRYAMRWLRLHASWGLVLFPLGSAALVTCGGPDTAVLLNSQEEVDSWSKWGASWGRLRRLRGESACNAVLGDLIINGSSINSLSNFTGLQSVAGDLVIKETFLSELSGLGTLRSVGGNLKIEHNGALASITGLAELASIGGELQIVRNTALKSLNGLGKVESMGGFRLEDSPQIKSLVGLESLQAVWGEVVVLETPLQVMGCFATAIRVKSFRFDAESWPRCMTAAEKTALVDMSILPAQNVLGNTSEQRWQENGCGADPVSCGWGGDCKAQLSMTTISGSSVVGTVVAISRANALCGDCTGLLNATIGASGSLDLSHLQEHPGRYSLCRCVNVGPIAELLIVGPAGNEDIVCNLGFGCNFKLQNGGVGMRPGFEIQVMPSCQGHPVSGGQAVLQEIDGEMTFHMPDQSNMSTVMPSLYQLCWKVPCAEEIKDGTSCRDPSNKTRYLSIGNFALLGAFTNHQMLVLGNDFTSSDAGFGVSSADKMMLLQHCGKPAGSTMPQVVATSGTDFLFDPGNLTSSETFALEYRKCWCQPVPSSNFYCDRAEDFLKDAGSVSIRCPAGNEDRAGNGTCEPCSPGSYKESSDWDRCVQCPAGFSAKSGSTSCTACEIGKVSAAGSSECNFCEAGTYANSTWSYCLQCLGGSFAEAGSVKCTACPPGHIAGPGSGSCRACGAGFAASTSQIECVGCHAGTYALPDDSACLQCPNGTFSQSGSSECARCQPGEIPSPMKSECLTCWAGSYAKSGNTECTVCPDGTVSDFGSAECSMCHAGTIASVDATQCKQCPAGQYASAGQVLCSSCGWHYVSKPGSSECTECSVWQVANPDHDACVAGSAYLFIYIAYILMLEVAFLLFFFTLRRRIRIMDVSLDGKRTLVRTARSHMLHGRFCKKSFPVKFIDTAHPGLDKAQDLSARVDLSHQLELFCKEQVSKRSRLDTSRGRVVLDFPHEFIHDGILLPMGVWIPLILLGAVALASSSFNFVQSSLAAAACLVSAATFSGLMRCGCLKFSTTPLEMSLAEFQQKMHRDGWVTAACPKGPGRAIAVGKLLQVHDFFRSFIRDRNAYYMDGNIFRPLTKASKLSFAELVGPSEVQWFVSHYWGTPFTHFCESLRGHAEAKEGVDGHWQDMSYWVCFCSINQYRIKEELGESWEESSFFITLRSGLCKGTCMVLDTEAMPLTRSWCIFELLQTLKLDQEENFGGLELCTATGLLNDGRGSVEVAMNLVKRMATLDLEAADASCHEDKDMINSLVMKEMGSFDAMNSFMRKEIREVLHVAQSKFGSQFQNLFLLLDIVEHLSGAARTPEQVQAENRHLVGKVFLEWAKLAGKHPSASSYEEMSEELESSDTLQLSPRAVAPLERTTLL